MNNLNFNNTKKILVYGDAILDHYIYGDVERISPEAPVPIIKHKKEEYKLGGAANVFQNLVSLGCHPELISIIGADDNGSKLLNLLYGSEVHIFHEQGKITPTKTRIVSDGQQLLRLDNETTHSISQFCQDATISYVKNIIKDCKVFILSDYGKGCFADLNPYFIPTLIEEAKKCGVMVIVDPHNGTFDSKFSAYNGAFCIKANRKQAEKLTDIKITNLTDCEIAIDILIKKYNVQFAMITMSEDGLLIKERFIASKHTPTKIVSLHKIRSLVEKYKNIVFTNGCFDIIHPGHIALLQYAKKQGDVLVVGLNSDSSIKSLKGSTRPIISQNDRAKVLAALECVDYICVFDEETPQNLIKEIEPHIHVKGGDHKNETEGVPKTLFFDRVGDYSTTKLIS